MSEGIDALITAEGFAGYGRWMRLLEIVAFKMDKTERCHAEFTAQKWCQLLGLKQKKLSSFLKLTENQLRTKVVCFENIIRIEIPNLLKKRDNYSAHYEVTTKRLPSIDVDVEKDVDKDKDLKTETVGASKKPTRSKPAQKVSDEDFITALKSNPAYHGVDVDGELGKMDAWLLAARGRRQKTRKFIVNWLNRVDRPLKIGEQNATSRHTGLAQKDYSAGIEDFYRNGKGLP